TNTSPTGWAGRRRCSPPSPRRAGRPSTSWCRRCTTRSTRTVTPSPATRCGPTCASSAATGGPPRTIPTTTTQRGGRCEQQRLRPRKQTCSGPFSLVGPTRTVVELTPTMPEPDAASRPQVTLPEAAALLHLPVEGVQALADAGYLVASKTGAFPLVDVKAFLARNADNGSGNLLDAFRPEADPQALLDALDGKSDEMARRAFDIFATAFPEATGWSLAEQARFIDQARSRFEAILAVTGQGAEVDEALVGDLQDVGASAAWEGSPLPQLLVVLRISRDLVVQTAVELAEEGGRHWGLALSLLLT